MAAERRYRITGAILTPKASGPMWTLTFTPEAANAGAPFDPDADREIVITLSPVEVDNLLFDVTYSKAEISVIEGPRKERSRKSHKKEG
jgi:hypothetical protein